MANVHVSVSSATAVSPELDDLFQHARHEVHAKRGGAALMTTLCAGVDEDRLLIHLVSETALWVAARDGQILGFAVVRERVVQAVYVATVHRRSKIASTLLAHVFTLSEAPVDALALPGDRAMKSLYESIGWKARLLTMRGA